MQVCLKSHHQKEMKWYLDSGYSRHMIGNRSWFKNVRPKDRGVVKFADGIKLKIIDIGNVGMNCKLQYPSEATKWSELYQATSFDG